MLENICWQEIPASGTDVLRNLKCIFYVKFQATYIILIINRKSIIMSSNFVPVPLLSEM